MIKINKQSEIEKYYDKETDTYVFKDDVRFTCNIDVKSSIITVGIVAHDINVLDIKVYGIKAGYISPDEIDITANDNEEE